MDHVQYWFSLNHFKFVDSTTVFILLKPLIEAIWCNSEWNVDIKDIMFFMAAPFPNRNILDVLCIILDTQNIFNIFNF